MNSLINNFSYLFHLHPNDIETLHLKLDYTVFWRLYSYDQRDTNSNTIERPAQIDPLDP